MSVGMAWWQLDDGTASDLPVSDSILVIAVGAQYLPRAATVAYADAMLSGDTLTGPRVNEVMSSAGSPPLGLSFVSSAGSFFSSEVPSTRWTPMAAAVLTTLQRPTLRSRLA